MALIIQGDRLSKHVNWSTVQSDLLRQDSYPRYRFGRRQTHDDVRDLRNLLKRITPPGRNRLEVNSLNDTSNNAYGKSIYGHSSLQRVMVKMRYSFKISSHRQFLENYMPQKNKDEVKNKPSLFGNVTLDEYNQRMTGKHFKFIISPESDKIPLESFTRAWIEKAEQQLGYKFVWQAVIHKDTGHPHVHILINGNDINGRDIKRIPKDFIKNQSHIIASEIATSMIGARSAEEIALANARTIEADRFTNYDQQILEQSTPIEDGRFTLSLRPITDALKKRLSHLRELNLAEYDADTDRYKLEKDFADKLHFAGRYNSFLQVRNKLQFTMPENLTLYTAATGKITGTVRAVYRMNDEDVWNNAVVVENEQLHKAWYVPLFNPPSNKIMEGGSIELNEYTNSKGLLVPSITLLDACGESTKTGERRPENGYNE